MKQAMPSSVMKECLGIVDSVTQSIQTVNTAAQRSLASNTWSHDQKYHTEKLHVFSMFLMLACILRYSQDMGWTCLKHELKAEWGGLPWVWSQLGHIASFRLAWATDRDFCIKKQQENRSHPSMGKIRHERDADLTFSHHAGEWWKVREVEIQLGFPALAKSLYMKLWRQEDKQDVIQKFSKLNLSPFYTKGRSGASPVVIHAASWLCPYYSNRVCSWFYCDQRHGALSKRFSIPTGYVDYTALQTHSISTPKVRPRQQQCDSLHGCFDAYARLRTLGCGSNRSMKCNVIPRKVLVKQAMEGGGSQ